MDKYEYKVRAEEIKSLIAAGEFAEAVTIADTIDWRRVKSVMMLCTISDLYKINRRFQESKDILLMAYERHPGGRLIVYSLCELSIKMGEFVQAIEYYKEFVQIAPKDTGRYILQYKLYEAQDVSLEERIAVLEEFKKRDYREKWAYELAYLYHRVGLETKCIEECDELIVWFGEGRYVLKALELKMIHQPLNAAQQEKYLIIKEKAELQAAEAAEENQEEEQPETTQDMEPAESEDNHKITEFSGYVQPDEEEEEFRVKTVDVGQYNTINLQAALAESMKEILGDDEPDTMDESDGDEEDTYEESETSSMGAITQSIVAPLLQETADIPDIANEVPVASVSDSLQEIQQELEFPKSPVEIPEPETATEEVFFEEDVRDVLLEDTKEINLGDTKELTPRKRVIYPSVSSKPMTPAHGPHLMKTAGSSGFEQMLSQEYDGQISLVVPEKSDIERQITGQMNIADIMAEWERMKRQNEEKRREDVRKRVQQHTGNLFSEFDEATKTGLLEHLEKAVVEAILKESGAKALTPDDITPERLTDIVRNVERSKEQQKEQKDTDKALEETKKSEASEETGTVSIDTGILELEKIVLEADKNKQENADTFSETADKDITAPEKEKSHENGKARALTEEEKELFGRFVHNKKAKEQIIHAIDTISLDSYSGNAIITGEEEAGTLDMAKGLVRMLQTSEGNFSGKVAKISGSTLNKKNVTDVLSKLSEGALIIEHATAMSSATAADLNKALGKENSALFVVMEGKKDEMNIFLRKNFSLMSNFNARVDIESLDDQSLVEYARQYAEEMEYSIDELGILALHTRIADMQTSDHEVTVAEVRDLVDDAIYFADKKNLKHLIDLLFGKRYDEEDMIVLREKDFMHY